jgi:hypothetical protein
VTTACLSTGPWHKGLYNFQTSGHDRSNSYAVSCINAAFADSEKLPHLLRFSQFGDSSDEFHFFP